MVYLLNPGRNPIKTFGDRSLLLLGPREWSSIPFALCDKQLLLSVHLTIIAERRWLCSYVSRNVLHP